MQRRKGISLIVLVITIIVMVILAGAIVLTLNNSGIISKAEDAVEQTNLATVRELAQMAWASAYSLGATEQELQQAVDQALVDSKVDTSKYKINVTQSGVTVTLQGEEEKIKWVQQGLTVTNGTQVLKIGDTIAYDETNSGTIEVPYDVEWQVLGASDEGELLILGTPGTLYIDLYGDYSSQGSDVARNGWLNIIGILDGLCEPYGKGTGVTNVRSVTLEDIDKITGYDKTKYAGDENYSGADYQYGEEFSCYVEYDEWAGGNTLKIYDADGNWVNTMSGEYFYNGETFVDLTIENANGKTLKNTLYTYNVSEMENIDDKVLQMLVHESYYWLATKYINCNTNRCGIYFLTEYGVSPFPICSLGGIAAEEYHPGWSIRPVVTLSADIVFEGSSETGWTY